MKFDTTITPTMLLLVGETDSREAAEFLESYLTGSVVFSRPENDEGTAESLYGE